MRSPIRDPIVPISNCMFPRLSFYVVWIVHLNLRSSWHFIHLWYLEFRIHMILFNRHFIILGNRKTGWFFHNLLSFLQELIKFFHNHWSVWQTLRSRNLRLELNALGQREWVIWILITSLKLLNWMLILSTHIQESVLDFINTLDIFIFPKLIHSIVAYICRKLRDPIDLIPGSSKFNFGCFNFSWCLRDF